MRYLITGANGFVGKYFIEYLKKQEPEAIIYGADITEGTISRYGRI
jgi:nucleoside-diphosphate-sugar epimerase